MTDDTRIWPSLPRQGAPRDKRQRELDRRQEASPRHDSRPPRRFDNDSRPPRHSEPRSPYQRASHDEARPSRFNDSSRPHRNNDAAPYSHAPRYSAPTSDGMSDDEAPRRNHRREELRVFGINAALAAFAKRPDDLRKAYLSEARLGQMRDIMAWCVKNRLGYRVVADDDLNKLTGSTHHEGVCLEMRRPKEHRLEEFLAALPQGKSACFLWLDGVGNPHNFGALLRSAAHFGIDGVLLPEDSDLALSGSACRVAEGGAESVPLVRLEDESQAISALRQAGFTLAATVPREGVSLFEAELPSRVVYVMGAEREGMKESLISQSDIRLTIPGSGQVESLNIASAVAVLLTAYVMRQS